MRPVGGHAVYIDARGLLPHVPRSVTRDRRSSSHSTRRGGVRGCEIGTVMFGRRPDGTEAAAAMDLVRLAIPRRTYTQSHIDYVIEVCAEVAGRAERADRLSHRRGACPAAALHRPVRARTLTRPGLLHPGRVASATPETGRSRSPPLPRPAHRRLRQSPRGRPLPHLPPPRLRPRVGQEAVVRTLRNAIEHRPGAAGIPLRRAARDREDVDGADPRQGAQRRGRPERRLRPDAARSRTRSRTAAPST